MNNDRPPFDPIALAAQLRLWAIDFAVWLAALLGEGSLCRSLRRWAHEMLDRGERGAAGLVVLGALKLLPEPVDLPIGRLRRPRTAPRGFARVAVRGNDMRRVTRHLFPHERDVLQRAKRLGAFLDTLAARAQRLTRRIARIMPQTRLAMIAPAVAPCIAVALVATTLNDSS